MPVTVVVARYKEDIKWTKLFNNDVDVLIYNKGEPLPEEYNQIVTENVGRESHTFYKYIHDNYDSLPDHIVFLQGHPFDHCHNIFDRINDYFSSGRHLTHGFELLAHRHLTDKLSDCVYGNHGVPMYILYNKIFQTNYDGTYEKPLLFGPGGQFVVSKERILKHPKELYARIVDSLDKHIDPFSAYEIERFHKIILDDDEKRE